MLVRKCDICRKVIPSKGYENRITASLGFDTFEFCTKCGVDIVRKFEKHNLIKKDV